MISANNLDPDDARQNAGPRLRSKMFDTKIIFQQHLEWKYIYFIDFYQHLKEENRKKLIQCLR